MFNHIKDEAGKLTTYTDILRNSFKEIDAVFEPLFKEVNVLYWQEKSFYSDD